MWPVGLVGSGAGVVRNSVVVFSDVRGVLAVSANRGGYLYLFVFSIYLPLVAIGWSELAGNVRLAFLAGYLGKLC